MVRRMLYRAEAFEPLTEAPWDEQRVRDAIRRLVADVDSAFDPDALWPADEWDGWEMPTPLKNLYVGAAGVIHALDVLRRRGVAETHIDLAAAATQTLALYREAPDFMRDEPVPSQPEASLLRGEPGIIVVAWRLSRSRELELTLLEHVRRNADSEADELMWGTPGTLVAARAMLARTEGREWRTACVESAEALWRRRNSDGIWGQQLYGAPPAVRLGPVHGLVGNVQALAGLLDEARRTQLYQDAAAELTRTAVVEDGLANWPLRGDAPLEQDDGDIRVQWCAGAPGIVASAAEYLDDELLLAGATLPWRTGPPAMEKGPGICHGTAGNGYAFLKTFERTGDEKWLVRARRFAMHALEQVERRGRGRYSLWTGDPGVALFVADCLEARTEYPVLETWD